MVARHGMQRPKCDTALEVRIRATQLRKGLLKDDDPEFTVYRLSKERVARPTVTGDAVVDLEDSPAFLPIIVKPHFVATASVDLLRQE